MFAMKVPKYLWGEALLTATYLINRLHTRTLSFNTPLTLLQKHYPDNRTISLLPLKVFGCLAYVHSSGVSKLDPRAEKCVFVGYAVNKKEYKCYNPHKKNSCLNGCYFCGESGYSPYQYLKSMMVFFGVLLGDQMKPNPLSGYFSLVRGVRHQFINKSFGYVMYSSKKTLAHV